MISRLRGDANVRYLYTGPQPGRGRRKLYDGKVKWKELDLARWHDEGEVEAGVHLYSATLNHKSLKRTIKVALLLTTTRKATRRRILLFSTDVKITGHKIVCLYSARFQIEFLFRDAKSGAGLTHCQSRNAQTLHNHWNAAFAVVNLAKITARGTTACSTIPFSFGSCRQKQRNVHFLQVVSCTLGLDWNTIKAHPRFQSLQNYAVIAP